MEPGLRTHKKASLRVAIAQGLPVDMWEQTRELVSVKSENRGRGEASGLLHKVCCEADRAWLTLIVMPEPFAEGLTLEQLTKFYAKHGFVEFQAAPVILMARSPWRTATRRVAATYHKRGWSDGKGYPTEYSDKP